MTPQRYERRIGSRNPAPRGLAVSWQIELGKWPKKRTVTFEATVVDISLSGARVVAPAYEPLRIGQRFALHIEGYNAEAEVRRIEPADESGAIIAYGLMFDTVDLDLAELIRNWVRREGDTELHETWLTLH